MKKLLSGSAIILMVCCLLIAMSETACATKIKLRLSSQMPPKHHTIAALEIMKEYVEKNTNGDIELNIYSSGQLFKGRELPLAVGSGAVEMGDMVSEYIANIFPEFELLDGPFIIDSKPLAQKIFSGPTGKLMDDKISQLGMKLVFAHPYGYFSTYGNNKREIKIPSDMEGMKIRAVGKSQILRAKAMGAKPQAIDGSEQFMAYKSGIVDIGQTGPTSFVSRKLYEVFKNGTTIRDNLMMFWCTMNLKIWNQLTDKEKELFKQAAQKASEYEWSIVEKEEQDADKFLENKMKMHIVTEDELKVWKKVLMPVNEILANDAGEAGKELYEALLKVK